MAAGAAAGLTRHRSPPRSRIYRRYILLAALLLIAVLAGAFEQIFVHSLFQFITRPPGTGAS